MFLHCQIPEPRVREKLLPLLLEWDLSRAAPGAAQFAATAIKKMAGAKGAAPWRFLLEVDAADPRERAVAARARERAREVRKANKVAEASRPSAGSDEPSSDFSDSASEGPGPVPSAADDDDRPQIEKDLAYFAAKPQTRAVRAELVRPALPELVARFERGGSTSTPAKDAEARAAGSARATPRGVPKARAADQRSILGFVTPRKDAEAAPSSRADIHGGLSSKGKEPAAFATPPATLVDVCAATPTDGAVATPLEMLTGSSSASLEAAGIPPPKTARRKILDDVRFGAHLDDGTRATAFRSIGVGVVDLTTPGSDPGESRKAPASARTTPGASPLASPTKRARQAGIKAFLTPKKATATAPAAGTPAAEVVDLVDSDDTP
jgi:flap endonuclease GEN